MHWYPSAVLAILWIVFEVQHVTMTFCCSIVYSNKFSTWVIKNCCSNFNPTQLQLLSPEITARPGTLRRQTWLIRLQIINLNQRQTWTLCRCHCGTSNASHTIHIMQPQLFQGKGEWNDSCRQHHSCCLWNDLHNTHVDKRQEYAKNWVLGSGQRSKTSFSSLPLYKVILSIITISS